LRRARAAVAFALIFLASVTACQSGGDSSGSLGAPQGAFFVGGPPPGRAADVTGGVEPECTSDADCDDGDPCTADRCDVTAGLCEHRRGLCADRCVADADCDDGNPCTADRCGAGGSCAREEIPGCAPRPCSSAQQCDDGDPCTRDACLRGRMPPDAQAFCNQLPIEGCGAGAR